ncbi:hypothetical protein KP509_26G004300 [Ceratopteris richardii]|uniref:Uncharacterized protein n=1 Tax=Ceratopteris richardii TaxID=49495 RepID=A0A8T2RHZ1_CERRI|nr:hypothetical protein KP509_26G004300 [Ceratopteris richardii]
MQSAGANQPENKEMHRSYLDNKLGAAARNTASKQEPKTVTELHKQGAPCAAEVAKQGDIARADEPRRASEVNASSANPSFMENVYEVKEKGQEALSSLSQKISEMTDNLPGRARDGS